MANNFNEIQNLRLILIENKTLHNEILNSILKIKEKFEDSSLKLYKATKLELTMCDEYVNIKKHIRKNQIEYTISKINTIVLLALSIIFLILDNGTLFCITFAYMYFGPNLYAKYLEREQDEKYIKIAEFIIDSLSAQSKKIIDTNRNLIDIIYEIQTQKEKLLRLHEMCLKYNKQIYQSEIKNTKTIDKLFSISNNNYTKLTNLSNEIVYIEMNIKLLIDNVESAISISTNKINSVM